MFAIERYLLERSPVGASNVLAAINGAIELVAGSPFAGRVTRRPSTRVLSLSSYPYLVVYQVSGNTVEIVTIRHAARKPLRGLNEPAQAIFAHG